MATLDALDRRILALFTEQPHVGVLGASRELGVARGTVQSRLSRLQEAGVISSWAPTLDPVEMGYRITAFLTLQIRQASGHGAVAAHLTAIPEVLEAHTVTGDSDLLVRVVARDTVHLQEVLDRVTAHDDVVRSASVISLAAPVPRRAVPFGAGA